MLTEQGASVNSITHGIKQNFKNENNSTLFTLEQKKTPKKYKYKHQRNGGKQERKLNLFEILSRQGRQGKELDSIIPRNTPVSI